MDPLDPIDPQEGGGRSAASSARARVDRVSLGRADIVGLVLGTMFGMGSFGLGAIGSVPICGGCFASCGLMALAGPTGFVAGLLSGLLADWARIPYDLGLRAGILLGMRAGGIAGLLGGTVYTLVAGVGRLGISVAGSSHSSASDAATGLTLLLLWDAAQNTLGGAAFSACVAGFWGLLVAAVFRRADALPAIAPSGRDRPFLTLQIVVGLCAAAVALLVLVGLVTAASGGFSGRRGGRRSAAPVPAAAPRARASPAPIAPSTRQERTLVGSARADPEPADAPSCDDVCDADCDGTVTPEEEDGCVNWETPGIAAGTTDEERLAPDDVAASRFLTIEGRYPPRQAFDGRNDTAWAVRDAVPGQDWIEARWRRPVLIHHVVLTTGYEKRTARAGDLFVANAHIAHCRVETDEGVVMASAGPTQRTLDIPLVVTTRRLRVIIDRVHPGTRWQDLSISEIRPLGER